jgi:hypothetical protein
LPTVPSEKVGFTLLTREITIDGAIDVKKKKTKKQDFFLL